MTSLNPEPPPVRADHGDLPASLRHALAEGPVLRTVHGSRLYGTAHSKSDHDSWVVVPQPRDPSPTLAAKKTFQSIETLPDGTVTDVTYLGLDTFLAYCANSIPQALEAMWSPVADVDRLGPMRYLYRADRDQAMSRYRRGIRDNLEKFDDSRPGKSGKNRRHAVRLALNLDTLLAHGRFSPRLTNAEKAWMQSVADTAVSAEHLQRRVEGLLGGLDLGRVAA